MFPVRFAQAAVLALILSISGTASAQFQKVMTLVKGEVTANDGAAAPDVSVAIYKGTEKIFTTKSNPDGKFNATLQPNTTYRVTFSNGNYQFREETLVVPAMEKFAETPLKVALTPLRNGEAFALNSQIFKPKSSTIEPDGTARLEDIVAMCKLNPKLKLEITVFPDETIKNKKQAAQEKLLSARSTSIRSLIAAKGLNEKQYTITESKVAPSGGGFAMEVTEKKKKKEVKKTVMVPQYIQVVSKVG